MGLITLLGHKAMKPKHWKQVWEKLQVEDPPKDIGDELTIRRIEREFKMWNKVTSINEICEAAQGEYNLEQKMAKIVREWGAMKFDQTGYRESEKDFILGDVEPITTLIEDHQVNLQGMLGSPFIAPLQQEVEEWAGKLSFLADLLDEWLLCQRNWMYLEPIFAADDIRKAMQKEAGMFKEVDRFFRKLQREVKKA